MDLNQLGIDGFGKFKAFYEKNGWQNLVNNPTVLREMQNSFRDLVSLIQTILLEFAHWYQLKPTDQRLVWLIFVSKQGNYMQRLKELVLLLIPGWFLIKKLLEPKILAKNCR